MIAQLAWGQLVRARSVVGQSEVDEAFLEALPDDGLDLWTWITAAIILVAAVAISRVAKFLLKRALDRRMDSALAELVARLLGYVIVIVGLVYALESLGVAVGPVLGALGIAGIALAFAFQDILENFVAGILLQLKRPFTYGDQVSINEHEGTVQSIDSRVVTILTPAGETLLIPSATVIKADINNYTQFGRRRTTLPVGVAYGTDLTHAQDVIASAVASVDGVLASPEPEVFFEGFGASSIDFAVRFWHEPTIASMWQTRSSVGVGIEAALAAADITIPFPQRTVWFADTEPATDG